MEDIQAIIAAIAPYLNEDENVILELVEKVLNMEDFSNIIGLIPKTPKINKIKGLMFNNMKQILHYNTLIWQHDINNDMCEMLISLMDRGIFIVNGSSLLLSSGSFATGFIHKDTMVSSIYNVGVNDTLHINSKYRIFDGDKMENFFNIGESMTNTVMYRNLGPYNKHMKKILLDSYFHFTFTTDSNENVISVINQLFGHAEIVEHENNPIENIEELTTYITNAIDLIDDDPEIQWNFLMDDEILPLLNNNIMELDNLMAESGLSLVT